MVSGAAATPPVNPPIVTCVLLRSAPVADCVSPVTVSVMRAADLAPDSTR